jgi:hypothetical protein
VTRLEKLEECAAVLREYVERNGLPTSWSLLLRAEQALAALDKEPPWRLDPKTGEFTQEPKDE